MKKYASLKKSIDLNVFFLPCRASPTKGCLQLALLNCYNKALGYLDNISTSNYAHIPQASNPSFQTRCLASHTTK